MTRTTRLAVMVIVAFLVPAVSTMAAQQLPNPTVAKARAGKNPFRIGRPLVIPHAGGDGFYPENTMVAWEQSMTEGGDVVDIDVSASADEVLIAFHDATLDRTTNGVGPVRSKSYAELSKLDAGWGFMRNGTLPYRGKNVRIPTVESVLRKFPQALVTLDLKDQRTTVVPKVCRLLKELGRTQDVYVGSDSNEQVLAFRKDCPELRTSGTDAERRAMRAARDAGNTAFVTHQLVSQPSYIAANGTKRITPKFLAFAHQLDIAVLPWVVDNQKDLSDLIDLGVDGIYTRRPDIMVKLLRQKGKL